MRRWLLIALLFVLPLQTVWGAAARYCAHETNSSAAHFGHHVHEHQDAQSQIAAADDGSGAVAVDLDCATCHLGYAATLPCSEVVVGAAAPSVPPSPDGLRYQSHTPSGIERPDIA